MRTTWRDFVKSAFSVENAPQSRTGFDRILDSVISKYVKPGIKRVLSEIPGGTLIPSVRRQAESDAQQRFEKWYSTLPMERQKRFHEVFVQPGIWAPGQREAIERLEFQDMPGSSSERMREIALSAIAGGRIKPYRPLIGRLSSVADIPKWKNALGGKAVGSFRKAGIKPVQDEKRLFELIMDDARRISRASEYGINSGYAIDSVLRGNKIIRDLGTLNEFFPGLRKTVNKSLRGSSALENGYRYKHGIPSKVDLEYGYSHPAELSSEYAGYKKDVFLDKYRVLLNSRVRNSLQHARFDRSFASRLPVPNDIQAASESIKDWIIQEAKNGKFNGRSQEEIIDLANRIGINPFYPNGRVSGTGTATWNAYGAGNPSIKVPLVLSGKNTRYANKNLLRHEFGHIIDSHGTKNGVSFNNARDGLRWKDFASGPRISAERAANVKGGISESTPWLDTYLSDSYDPSHLLDVWRRYKYFKKPNIPQ